MISHVVFDFDGTLADSLELAVELYNGIAVQRGYGTMTKQNLAELRALSIPERCRRLGVPALRLPGLVVEVGRLLQHAAARVALHEGVPELVRTLHGRRLQLAIVSTNREATIRAILEREGLAGAFGPVSCGSRVFGKARPLRQLVRAANAPAARFVYVGDEHRDVEASRTVGMRAIGVTWGADAPERLRAAAPDALATSPAQIVDLVRQWSQ